jgi:hypothetical protein
VLEMHVDGRVRRERKRKEEKPRKKKCPQKFLYHQI